MRISFSLAGSILPPARWTIFLLKLSQVNFLLSSTVVSNLWTNTFPPIVDPAMIGTSLSTK
jgi:hypothetical protein